VSTFAPVDVHCPWCAAQQTVELATGVNAARSPAARQAVLAGSFQQVRCGSCGLAFTPLCPFTWVDFTRAQLFGVFPEQDETHWVQAEQEILGSFNRTLGEDAPEVPAAVPDVVHLRVVFGLSRLREKLVVMDAGLDDGIVEILKLRWMLAHEALDQTAPLVRSVAGAHLLAVHSSGHLVLDRSEHDQIEAAPGDLADLLGELRSGPYRDVNRVLNRVADRVADRQPEGQSAS
jgi:hypothetical protein